MRVLMVTLLVPDARAPSGGAVVLHGQLAALLDRHEVTLATLAGPDVGDQAMVDRLLAAGVEVHAAWQPAPVGAELWRRRLRAVHGLHPGGHPLRTLHFPVPKMQLLLDRLLTGRRFDMLQVEDVAMGAYRFPGRAPCVLTEHEVRATRPADAYDRWRSPALQWAAEAADWRRWQRFQPAVWRRFDRVQVFTSRDAAAVGHLAPDIAARVRVNPFGVALPKAADPGLEELNHLLFVGGFRHPPNVDAALWLGHEVLPRLRARCPGVRLTIVGDAPPPAVLALAVGDTAVTGRVPAIEPFLERAAVVLAPIRSGGGMRVKVLQGMAIGKAVVTTPLGAEGLEGGDQVPVVIGEDAEGLAVATAALLADPVGRRLLGQRARTFVAEHYSWAAYGRRLEATYQELVP